MVPFIAVVSELRLVEVLMVHEINEGGAPSQVADLLRRAAQLSVAAERHTPTSVGELHDMIAWLTHVVGPALHPSEARRRIDLAGQMLKAYQKRGLPDRTRSHVTRAVPRAEGDPGTVAREIAESRAPTLIIGADHRVCAVNAAVAEAHRRSAVGLIGTHVADLVGYEDFALDARAHLERCFAGEAQDYVSSDATRRRVHRMRPVRGPNGTVYGCMVVTRERSPEVRPPQAPLDRAAGDHPQRS